MDISKLTTIRIERKMTTHPLWHTWFHMMQRCYFPVFEGYYLYGGRGISVCDRWATDFWAFVEDMGLKPSPKHTIDRINNDGNYEPSNCRWVTRAQQMRNTRRTRIITVDGKTMCMEDWAQAIGVDAITLYARAKANGWNWEAAVRAGRRTPTATQVGKQLDAAIAILESKPPREKMTASLLRGELRSRGWTIGERRVRNIVRGLYVHSCLRLTKGRGRRPAFFSLATSVPPSVRSAIVNDITSEDHNVKRRNRSRRALVTA